MGLVNSQLPRMPTAGLPPGQHPYPPRNMPFPSRPPGGAPPPRRQNPALQGREPPPGAPPRPRTRGFTDYIPDIGSVPGLPAWLTPDLGLPGGGGAPDASAANQSTLQTTLGYTPVQMGVQRDLANEYKEQGYGSSQEIRDRLQSGDPSSIINDETTGRFIEQNIADPARRNLNEIIMPQLNQRFGGGGGFWGSSRARASQRAIQDTENSILTEGNRVRMQDEQARRGLNESALQRALGAQQYSPDVLAANLLQNQPVDTVATPPVVPPPTVYDNFGIPNPMDWLNRYM